MVTLVFDTPVLRLSQFLLWLCMLVAHRIFIVSTVTVDILSSYVFQQDPLDKQSQSATLNKRPLLVAKVRALLHHRYSYMSIRRTLRISGAAAIDLLRTTYESVDIFPLLKSVAGDALSITDLVVVGISRRDLVVGAI